METMPPYTYKFVKNQGSDSENNQNQKTTKQNKKDKHGYLSKDVKVINDLIDDLSKLKTADHVSTTAAHAVHDGKKLVKTVRFLINQSDFQLTQKLVKWQCLHLVMQ